MPTDAEIRLFSCLAYRHVHCIIQCSNNARHWWNTSLSAASFFNQLKTELFIRAYYMWS